MVISEGARVRPESFAARRTNKVVIGQENIFVSPKSAVLTPRGRDIQKVLIDEDALRDPELTQNKRWEIESEIKKTCRRIGVSSEELPIVGEMFNAVISERHLKIERLYPIY